MSIKKRDFVITKYGHPTKPKLWQDWQQYSKESKKQSEITLKQTKHSVVTKLIKNVHNYM